MSPARGGSAVTCTHPPVTPPWYTLGTPEYTVDLAPGSAEAPPEKDAPAM